MIADIHTQGADLLSINVHIDTTIPTGKLTFHLFAALAKFERDIIHDWTQVGLAVAQARVRKGGKPQSLPRNTQHTAIID